MVDTTIKIDLTFDNGRIKIDVTKNHRPDLKYEELVLATLVVDHVDQAMKNFKFPESKEALVKTLNEIKTRIKSEKEGK